MKSHNQVLLLVFLSFKTLLGQCKLDSFDNYQIDKKGKALYGEHVIIKYITNGNQSIEEWLKRDTVSKKLSSQARTIETLDTKGRTLSSVRQYFNNGAYINNTRMDYSYFTDGKLESEIEFRLDFSKQFIISKKNTYQYDSLRNYKFIQHFFYNKSLGKYETYYDQTFKYFFDSMGNIIKKFDVDIWPTYFTNKRYIYTYDANGKLQREIYQFNTSAVKFDESSFLNRERNEYVYDLNKNIISFSHYAVPTNDTMEHLIQQIDYTYDAKNRILLIIDNGCRTDFEYSNTEYTERYMCGEILFKNYYSCIVSNSKNSLKNEFSISLNPTSNVLYINLPPEDYTHTEYQIIDLYGRIISGSNLNDSRSINIAELSVGNYFLLIKQKDQTRTLRFCKGY